ncbi:MAG: hypothetical protein HQK75_08440 [Candidatus Magnetomorum sp.]|nr:hypothetical protein [Candidatus Magnetomorum sp.]
MKNINKLSTITTLYLLIIFTPPASAVEYFTDVVTPTNLINLYLGTVSFTGGYTVATTDEIGVFVDDGNNGRLLVGSCNIGVDGNSEMYRVYIYGDDDTSDATKTGAYHDDELIFVLFKQETGSRVSISESDFLTETAQDLTEPSFPLKFVESQIPATFGYLNLTKHLNFITYAKYVSVPALNIWGQIILILVIVFSYFYIKRKKNFENVYSIE